MWATCEHFNLLTGKEPVCPICFGLHVLVLLLVLAAVLMCEATCHMAHTAALGKELPSPPFAGGVGG